MGLKPRPPDCCTCGACCVAPYDQDVFCNVTQKDLDRLPVAVRRRVVHPSLLEQLAAQLCGQPVDSTAIRTKIVEVRRGPLKGCVATVCACLRGSPMCQVSCSVYMQRPAVCRKVIRPGDRLCRQLRRELLEEMADGPRPA